MGIEWTRMRNTTRKIRVPRLRKQEHPDGIQEGQDARYRVEQLQHELDIQKWMKRKRPPSERKSKLSLKCNVLREKNLLSFTPGFSQVAPAAGLPVNRLNGFLFASRLEHLAEARCE